MNDSIMNPLQQIQKKLTSGETVSSETADSMIGELEMIQTEIQQHMTNMPSSNEYRELRRAAQHAVSNLSEILVLLEELSDADPNEQEELICETLRMLDEIRY